MKRRIMLLAAIVLATPLPAAADTLARLERPDLYDLQFAGFELFKDAEVEIEAVGLAARDARNAWNLFDAGSRDDRLSAYAWILDSETRRPVWVMDYDDTDWKSGSRRLVVAEESIRLPAGRYEVYMFSGHGWAADLAADRQEDRDDPWWERIWSDNRRKARGLEKDLEECYVRVSSDRIFSGDLRRFEVTADLPDALVRHNRLGDSQRVVTGLAVKRPARLKVYGLFEKTENSREAADHGWIVDARSRKRVWSSRDTLAGHAGGAAKNRLMDGEIRLEPGTYLLYFGTDDSHSFERFNANPPHDPLNWGITLQPGEGLEGGNVEIVDPPDLPAALIEFARAGDRELFEQPFRVDRDAELHVYALGESAGGDELADSAWITDAISGRTVWEMTGSNTFGAGGAEKNRMFDGMLRLPQGTYVLFYVTDGSHAFSSWNAATPFDPEGWGVTLRPGPEFDPDHFRKLDPDELARDSDLLVRMVRVGDDERRRTRFTLDRTTRLRIFALGEGDSDEMYDYGYIIDDRSGRSVWEMSWRNTEHAGGARKNRIFDDVITLDAGTYEAIYVTDDSHSFRGWNAGRPDNPMAWGMTVGQAE